MSASKKTTTKTAKSPAPATKPASTKAPARKKAPDPAPARTATVAPPSATPPPAIVPAAPAAAVAPVKARPVVTIIAAQVDVGFGNALHLRGEGPGLSWDQGVPMECVAADLWQISLGESARGFTFKFLVNDLTWCVGPDYTLASGASVTLTPEF
ncbi:MAG: hypothetical protein FJ399_09640 [Verrucomicrobia bacterium]|nr:hypothetical protein [Verrucomicrobiota bacterium]